MATKKATTKKTAAKKTVVKKTAVTKEAPKKITTQNEALQKEAPKKAATKKAAPKCKGIAELKRSAIPMSFVKANNGAWNHDLWLGFLNEIEAKGFCCDADEVGLLLEAKKEEFWAKQ